MSESSSMCTAFFVLFVVRRMYRRKSTIHDSVSEYSKILNSRIGGFRRSSLAVKYSVKFSFLKELY